MDFVGFCALLPSEFGIKFLNLNFLNLVPGEIQGPNDYCELGIWIGLVGLAPAIDTYNTNPKYFYAGIHVHARKEVAAKFLATSFRAYT